jgi:uncharacterized protein with PIN domain
LDVADAHSARLNIVDRFSYACAKALKGPLLFQRDDLSQTDVQAVGSRG